jgi:gluconolactonase
VVPYGGQPFLANRRLFAMADTGAPHGIKCDEAGNVYAGCGDGINVWSAGGILLGKILIPGGVSGLCFCRPGEVMALGGTRLWRVKLSPTCRGALVRI